MLDAQGAVEGVPDGNTLVGVLEGLVDDVVEEQVEEGWSEDTSLSHTVVDAERLGGLAVGSHRGARVGMKLPQEALEFLGETCLSEDLPEGCAVDGVICLGKVNETDVSWGVELG